MGSGGEASDEALAEEAKRGSEEAFTLLVGRFERPVYSLLFRILRQADLAEDIAQEAFVKAWRALDRFDTSRKFSSWIFKIAHNSALDHLRKQGIDAVSLDAPIGDGESPLALPADPRAEDPLARLEARDSGRALEQAIADLKPHYREILLLRFQQELSYEEIAEILDVPLGTVKIQIFRGRTELAAKMHALGWDPKAAKGAKQPRMTGVGPHGDDS